MCRQRVSFENRPTRLHAEGRILNVYNPSISRRISSLVLPSRCCRRPSNSSSFPSANVRSSSVSCAYFCFSFPLISFQLPLIWSLFMPSFRRRKRRWMPENERDKTNGVLMLEAARTRPFQRSESQFSFLALSSKYMNSKGKSFVFPDEPPSDLAANQLARS
jgi:hypothetical protein